MKRVRSRVALCLFAFLASLLAACDGKPPADFAPGETQLDPPNLWGSGEVFAPKQKCIDALEVLRRKSPLLALETPVHVGLRGFRNALYDEAHDRWVALSFALRGQGGDDGYLYDCDCSVGSSIWAALAIEYGLWGVNLETGYDFEFEGLPEGSIVKALRTEKTETFLAGISIENTSSPLLYRCVVGTRQCTPLAGSPTPRFAFDGVESIDIFGGKLLFGLDRGLIYSTDGGVTMKTPTGIGGAVYGFAELNGSIYAVGSNGVYRSADGASWSSFSTGLASIPNARAIATLDGNLYVTVGSPSADVLVRGPGDATWSSAGTGLAGSVGVRSLAVGQKGLYRGTAAGPYRLEGTTWVPVRAGLEDKTTYYAGAFADADRVLLGTESASDAIARSGDGGRTWTTAVPLGSIRAFAATGSVVHAAGGSGYFRSTDGGVTFTRVVPTGLPQFIAYSGVAISNGRLLLTTYLGDVVASTDGGATFAPSKSGAEANQGVNSIAVRGADVALGAYAGVFVSHDSGVTWTKSPAVATPIATVAFAGGALWAAPQLATPPLLRLDASGASATPISTGLSAEGLALVDAGSTLFLGTTQGLFKSTDAGASWARFSSIGSLPVPALAISGSTLFVGTGGTGLRTFALPLRVVRFLPIVLDVVSGSARYTSELALTNRGTTAVTVTLKYTAALGSGSGTATETLAAGRQLVIADAIAYLRQKGLPIPAQPGQAGTLLLTFEGASGAEVVAATARTGSATAAPHPSGRAGLAYVASDPAAASHGTVAVYGLRSTAADRSNLAIYNPGADPVTLEVTVHSGSGDGASAVIAAAETLPAYGWKQFNRVLEGPGYANGWATVRRTSASGGFGAYGVINDNATNDGSFVTSFAAPEVPAYQNVAVLVETPSFRSELILSNAAAGTATLKLSYRESLTGTASGTATVTLAGNTQLIAANAIEFLRQKGVPIGPAGAASYAGSLHVAVSGVPASSVFAGARTSSPSPGGGQFGVFTPAFEPGSDQLESGYVYGLRADASNRSNVAAVNTGDATSGPITLTFQAYDGDAGGAAKGSAATMTLAPGQWAQLSGFLGAQGVANGWVRVSRTAGGGPWIAYGVLNDGGGPGQATGDGAFVPISR